MSEVDVLYRLGGQLARIATALEAKPAPAFVMLIDVDSVANPEIPLVAAAVSAIKLVGYDAKGGHFWVDFSPAVGKVYRIKVLNGEEVCAALGLDAVRLRYSAPAVELANEPAPHPTDEQSLKNLLLARYVLSCEAEWTQVAWIPQFQNCKITAEEEGELFRSLAQLEVAEPLRYHSVTNADGKTAIHCSLDDAVKFMLEICSLSGWGIVESVND
jgi:hypothetical protein